jgi:hypothetical protein
MNLAFNENSWHARLFRTSYITNWLPDNLCCYFWMLVAVIVCLPITFISYLWPERSLDLRRYERRTPWYLICRVGIHVSSFAILALITAMGAAFMQQTWPAINPWTWWFVLLYPITGLCITVVGILILCCVCWLLSTIGEWINSWQDKDEQPAFPRPPGLLVSYFKAWKHKYCPHIEWKK